MEIKRTANAGILLKLDGVSILLDGVCRGVKPYPATPPEIRSALSERWPDVLAFTHAHKDHYDPDFASAFQRQTNGVILGTTDLPGCKAIQQPVSVGDVKIIPVESRHIGKAGQSVQHLSFIVRGSFCVWFAGDASPMQWRGRNDLPRPDVLIVPYAYATTKASWRAAKQLGAKEIVLLHLPLSEEDPSGLWEAVRGVTDQEKDAHLHIPGMGENICIF